MYHILPQSISNLVEEMKLSHLKGELRNAGQSIGEESRPENACAEY